MIPTDNQASLDITDVVAKPPITETPAEPAVISPNLAPETIDSGDDPLPEAAAGDGGAEQPPTPPVTAEVPPEELIPDTTKYGAFVRKLFNRSKVGDLSKDFAHAILGVETECDEYLLAPEMVNAIEELGDIEFYVEAAFQVVCDILGPDHVPQKIIDVANEHANKWLNELIQGGSSGGALMLTLREKRVELLDTAKRYIGYDKTPPDPVKDLAIILFVANLVKRLGLVPASVPYEHIRMVNMRKLFKRYPGGEFSQGAAINRDLQGERATLEAANLG